MKPILAFRVFLPCAFVLTGPLAQAATYYWDTNGNTAGFGSVGGTWNSGNTALWSTSSAGTATTPNVTTGNLDDINFGTAAIAYSGTVTLSGNTTARSATFSGSSNVVLKGNGTARTLTLGSGGLTMNGTSTATLGDGVAGNNLLINLGAAGQTWTNNSTNNLTILNTAATFSRSAGGTIAFNKTSTGEFAMSTTVLPNEASGIIGSWAFFGTGTSIRYAYNNSGTIAGYSSGTAATDAEAFTSSATNYDFSTTGTTTLSANRAANTLRYNGTGNVIDLGASGSNTLTTNGILAVGSSGILTIQRSGGTGTLVAGSTGTNSELVIAGPQSISISAPISNGVGNSALTYSGTGTLNLSGDNTYSGATTVNSGTLVVGSATALGAAGKALNVNGAGTLNFNGFDYTVGALNGDNGNATITNSGATVKSLTVGSGNATGTFAGAITGNLSLAKIGSGTLSLLGTNTYSGGTSITGGGSITNIAANSFGAGQITFTGNSTLQTVYGDATLANNVVVNSGATATLSLLTQFYDMTFNGVLSGDGTVRATAGNGGANFANTSNSFTGTIIVDGGSGLSVSSLGSSSNAIQLGATTTAGTFTYNGGATLSRGLVMAGTTGAATVNASGAGALTLSSFSATGSGAKTLTLGGSSSASNNMAGNIVNNGGNTSVTKSGSGKWILSGSNSYSGTTINGFNNPASGGLVFEGIQALSASTTLQQTHAGGSGGFGTISILDNGPTPASRSGVNINMLSSNTSHTMTLYVDRVSGANAGSTIELGNLNLTQNATGNTSQTLAVTGANGYGLKIGGINIALNGSYTSQYSAVLNPTTAPLTVSGNVQQTDSGGVGSSVLLSLQGTATGNLISGNVLDSLGVTPKVLALTKTNTTGDWTLTGNNSYTGNTTISGGRLEIGGNGVLGGGSYAGNISIASTNSGNLKVNSTANQTFSGVISGAGALVKDNTGRLTLTNDNSYSGATTITGGVLEVSGTGDINQSSGITIESGANLKYNSSVALTTGITNNGGTISGTGDIGVAVTLNSTTDILAPGNSPGVQEYTVGQTWASFTYQWEVNDFDGTTAGTDFDQIQISNTIPALGTLTLTGATAGSYILDLVSLAGLTNVAGNVADFSETTTSWTILSTTGGISGFDAAYWTILDDNFTSSPTWAGTWSLDNVGNDLVLTYTVIPEPATALLGCLGLLLILRRRR